MKREGDILIIDDDRDLVSSMQLVLESKKYPVRTAYNGKEGYAQILKKTPGVVILDVMMATDTEGFDLAYKLHNHIQYRDIPILMLTSFPQKMAEKGPDTFQHILGENWPVNRFLEKPIEPEILLSTVEELLTEFND